MWDELQSRLPVFRARLSETIAWCMRQTLETNPIESPEIKRRRKLGEEAAKLSRRAFLSHAPAFWKFHLHHRARRLFAQAKLEEIKPLAEQLRSTLFRPEFLEFPSDPEERIAIVEKLSEKRADQLRNENRYPTSLVENLAGGKLLLYAPDDNLCDGGSQFLSKGFFDVNNIPPWDTWICLFESYLVSWVPMQLLSLANEGIDVNPEQCIFWAPESGLPNV